MRDEPVLTDADREVLSSLEGLIPDAVGVRLAELAALVPSEQCIVEIGSYRGKSTCYLASGSRAGFHAPVFAVDPWDSPGNVTGRFSFAAERTREAFMAQVKQAGYSAIITPFRAFSRDMARHWLRPIGLLYVDGSHTAGDVQRDWDCWSPHLAAGAAIAFDDYRTERNPGVAIVVDKLRATAGMIWQEGPAPLVVGWKG